MPSFNKHHSLWSVFTIFTVGLLSVTTADDHTQGRKPLISVGQDNRILRRRRKNNDPKTVLLKVPKIAHITIADDPPPHQEVVLEYSSNLIIKSGFELMVHRDSDVERLITAEYPDLLPPWKILKSVTDITKGARMGDFVRILLMHHYGGVYLDVDMIPCYSMETLIKEPGVATFPLVNAYNKQVMNSIMSAPPGHPVFWIALEKMRKNKNLGREQILKATGPHLLRSCIWDYFAMTGTPEIININENEQIPEPADGSIWLQSGLIRFGAVMRYDRDWTRGMGTLGELGLVHLHFRSWVSSGAGAKSKISECAEDVSLIGVFLDYKCHHVRERDSVKWSECGNGNKQSGMLGLDA